MTVGSVFTYRAGHLSVTQSIQPSDRVEGTHKALVAPSRPQFRISSERYMGASGTNASVSRQFSMHNNIGATGRLTSRCILAIPCHCCLVRNKIATQVTPALERESSSEYSSSGYRHLKRWYDTRKWGVLIRILQTSTRLPLGFGRPGITKIDKVKPVVCCYMCMVLAIKT